MLSYHLIRATYSLCTASPSPIFCRSGRGSCVQVRQRLKRNICCEERIFPWDKIRAITASSSHSVLVLIRSIKSRIIVYNLYSRCSRNQCSTIKSTLHDCIFLCQTDTKKRKQNCTVGNALSRDLF